MHTLDLVVPLQLSIALGPDLLLIAGAMILLLWAAWRPDGAAHQRAVALASIVLTLVTGGVVWWYLIHGYTAERGPIAVDNFRWMADLVILAGTAFAVALGRDDNDRQGIGIAESHVLVLLASSGMMLLAAARDLIIVFLAVELMSIAVYALAGLNCRCERAAEGALKYFLLGAFSSAFLLYGIALMYGATGTTNLTTIAQRIAESPGTFNPLVPGSGTRPLGVNSYYEYDSTGVYNQNLLIATVGGWVTASAGATAFRWPTRWWPEPRRPARMTPGAGTSRR